MSAHLTSIRKKSVRHFLQTVVLTSALIGLSTLAAHAGAPGEEQNDDRIQVQKDFTQTLDLDQSVSGIVIGNPGIADVSLRNDMSLFVHGRSPGLTNMLVYDDAGNLIKEYVIEVSAAQKYLTLRKGSRSREHFSCVGRCERVVRMDDDPGSVVSQAGNVGIAMGLANGVAPEVNAPSAMDIEENTRATAQAKKDAPPPQEE